MRLRGYCFVFLWSVFIIYIARPTSASPSVWDTLPDSTGSPGDTLTLERALFRVRNSSPLLASVRLRASSNAALVKQAGARANPNLSIELENVDGDYSGLDRSEITMALSQEFALGGLRTHRRGIAQSDADASALTAQLDAFQLYVEVARRHARIVHAEARLDLVRQAGELLDALSASAAERVRVGAALVADRLLGEAAQERAAIESDDARSDVLSERRSLSALWGDARGFSEPVRPRRLPHIEPDSLLSLAARGPSVRRVQIELRNARASRALERSLRWPSLTADVGVRRIDVDDAYTFVIGMGVPLPLLDGRKQGVAAQEARAHALEQTVLQAQAESQREAAERTSRLERFMDRARRTDAVLLPARLNALNALREAYAIGRVSYSDLLETQRNVVELQLERNDLELAIVEEILAIEHLLGKHIEENRHE